MEKGDICQIEGHVSTGDDLKKVSTIDTLHNDEGLKVLATYAGDEHWEPEEEKKLVRKIDRRLLSMLCITYALQYYDKAMLSQAALFGLRKDLQLSTGNRYSFSAAIFYLGFIVGAYPATIMSQRWPIERVASGIVGVWGVTMMATAGCTNWQGFYAQRFFLGFIESGVSPMFMLVVGGWYKKQEQALRMGAWYSCTGYVSIVSPLVNYGLGHITSGSLKPWQYMYLIAGALTLLWSISIYFFLPPDPIRVKGFTDRERYIAVARMRGNNAGVRNTHFKFDQVVEAVTDIRFWLLFLISFCALVANGPLSTFVPIFINSFGFNVFTSLLLIMPAGFIVGSIELGSSYLAYRIPGIRTYIMIVCQAGGVLSALLLWLLPRHDKGGLLFGCYILGCFGGTYAVSMGLQIANTAGYTKRSVTSSGIFVGYCLGNFAGPLFFKPEDAPRYASGFTAVLVTSAAALVLSGVYRLVCVWENKRRDQSGTMEAFEHAFEDDLTDRKNPQFRYTI